MDVTLVPIGRPVSDRITKLIADLRRDGSSFIPGDLTGGQIRYIYKAARRYHLRVRVRRAIAPPGYLVTVRSDQ